MRSMNMVGWSMNAGYHPDKTTGYGRFGSAVHEALLRAGVADLGAVGINEEIPDPEGYAPVAFYAATPPHVVGWREGQLAALFTMWEFTEMPVGFRENVPEFGRLFVPSLQNQELFSAFNDDVRYVPLAVGPEWGFRKRKPPEETFNFLTGGAGPRKGCTTVVRAFDKVFHDWKPSWGPRPHLTVRAATLFEPPGPSFGIIGNTHSAENVTYLRRTLKPEVEIELYADSHCFVSGSKGEGWGFMPHQAIAQGMPTILGEAHGHAAFAKYGLPIRTHLQKPEIPTHWGEAGEEWEPDFPEMCDYMEDVYRTYDFHVARAQANAWEIAEEFSWDKTAAKLIENLPELGNEWIPEDAPWVEMPQRLYTVRVNQHSPWCINGRLETYDPGYTYRVPWADKLLMAQAGHLTQDCMDPRETGQYAWVADEDTAPERCPHCRQKYGLDDSLLPENLVGPRE